MIIAKFAATEHLKLLISGLLVGVHIQSYEFYLPSVLGTSFAETKVGFNTHRGGTMKTCEKCQGSMVMERAVDLEVGLSILYFACLNCGKRIQAEKEPQPLVH